MITFKFPQNQEFRKDLRNLILKYLVGESNLIDYNESSERIADIFVDALGKGLWIMIKEKDSKVEELHRLNNGSNDKESNNRDS